MAILKCCVNDCNATNETHRLFCFPKDDELRKLWMSFLVPKNPLLIGLSMEQLHKKRVCERHFDKYQFDIHGQRLRHSYPCLFSEKEITHGTPLAGCEGASDHSYAKVEEVSNDCASPESLVIMKDALNEHNYSKSLDDTTKPSMVTGQKDLQQPSCSYTSILECGPADPSGSHHITSDITEVVRPTPDDKGNQLQNEKVLSMRKFSSKQRRYMKKVKDIAMASLGDTASQRLEQASSVEVKELLEKFNFLNKQAQTFLLMQLKQVRKNKMARRYTLDEKLMSLLLCKQSPKGYKLLEHMFALPNKRTLNRLSGKITLEPGLNPKIFDYIQNKIKNWDTKKRLCTIVFDEVSLTPHLTFNEQKDIINGFVDVAGERKLKFTDHALVFMARGICTPWRQSLAYYFCEGTVSSDGLQTILKELVSQIALTGLIPLGLVCDQGSTFRTAIKKIREDTIRLRNIQGVPDDGSINIAGVDLSVFFDPPHLLKGLRNNLLTKDVTWDGKTASWKDIEFIYDLDSKLGHTRALPKLTAHHVDRKKIKKMKVSVAAQVLSTRTAAMLRYTDAVNNLHSSNNEENTMAATAEFVEFADKLFDSVNGCPGATKKGKLRKAVKKNSEHHAFWTIAIKKLKDMRFIDRDSKLAKITGNTRLVKVPSLQGWITSLESFCRLSKLLFDKYDVDYYYPRNINQDPLENFFGRIRALNYRNVNPDANTFIYTFKSLLLTNVLSPHSKFANCEVDNGESLLDVDYLFKGEDDKENATQYVTQPLPSTSQENRNPNLMEQVRLEKIKVHCSAYTAGFIARRMYKVAKCKQCLRSYASSNVENIHKYIHFREYKMLKNNNLVYPSARFLILYRESAQFIHDFLNVNCYKQNVGSSITKCILNKDLSWLGCFKHKSVVKNTFVKMVVRLQVHNWCNILNKILKGDIEEKYVSKMSDVHKLALKKYQSFRVRRKCLNK